MGEVELIPGANQLIIHSVIFFYGEAANDGLSLQIAGDIAGHWNAVKGEVRIKNIVYEVLFDIKGIWARSLTPEMIFENNNPRNNYFRIEAYASGNISFVDNIGCNTGYFKLDNLLNNSTTAAHEYGHTIGLHHPEILDIRGRGVPGTMNPFCRKVLPEDINNLNLQHLAYNRYGKAMIGNFTNIWHEQHQP